MSGILELVESHVKMKKAATTWGGEWHGPCPDCGGTDRLRVWPDYKGRGSGFYSCRGCGKAGDEIQFLRDFEGLGFREACERLNREIPESAWLRTPKHAPPKAFDGRECAAPEEIWKEKARKFTSWCFDQLFVRPQELKWLKTKRGLTEETVTRFGLGWNPGEDGKDIFRAREGWGLPELINEKTGKRRALWLPVGLVIPWYEGRQIVRLRIRRHGDISFGPRYYVVPGSGSETMAIPVMDREARIWVIVESELDGILIHQVAGDIVGAMAMGSVSTRPDVAATAMLRGAVCILNALDYDAAGEKYRTWWEEEFSQNRRWPAPEGKDPGEAWEAGVNLREWILAGLPEGLRLVVERYAGKQTKRREG